MRKILSVLLCILMLCAVLCGCGGNDSVSEMATDAMSEAESAVDGLVSDGDGHIGNETTTPTDNTDDMNSENSTEESTNNDSGTGNNEQSTSQPIM